MGRTLLDRPAERDPLSDDLIRHVSDTALWVAGCRAIESERPDALFHDPFAGRLAGERGRTIATTMREADATQWSVAIRTVVIDSFIQSAVGAGAETVLSLGAGLDARPYRMDLPSELRWIEIDYPSVVDQKDAALRDETPRCRVERIGLDLAQIHERRDLFERIDADSSVTVVLTEGVVPYLTNDEAGALAEDLRARPSFSAWIIDYFAPVLLEYLRKRRRHSAFTFSFEPGDWERFFVDRGWSVAEMRYLGEESLRLGRHVPMPLAARLMRLGMPPARRREMSRMNGYALLEPTDGVARPLR